MDYHGDLTTRIEIESLDAQRTECALTIDSMASLEG